MSSTQTNLDSITTQSGQPGSALSVPTNLETEELKAQLKAANLETEELKAQLKMMKLKAELEAVKLEAAELKAKLEAADAEKKKVDLEKKKVEMTPEFCAVLSKEKLEALKKKKLEEKLEKALKELDYMKKEKKEDAEKEKEKKKVDVEKKKVEMTAEFYAVLSKEKLEELKKKKAEDDRKKWREDIDEMYAKDLADRKKAREDHDNSLTMILGMPTYRYSGPNANNWPRSSDHKCLPELTACKCILYLLKNETVCINFDPRDTVVKGFRRRFDGKFDGTLEDDYSSCIHISGIGFCPNPDCANFTKDIDRLFIYALGLTLGLMVNGRLPKELTDSKSGKRPSLDGGYGGFITQFDPDEFRRGTTESFKTLANEFIEQAANPELPYSIQVAIAEIEKVIETYGGDYTIGASSNASSNASRLSHPTRVGSPQTKFFRIVASDPGR